MIIFRNKSWLLLKLRKWREKNLVLQFTKTWNKMRERKDPKKRWIRWIVGKLFKRNALFFSKDYYYSYCFTCKRSFSSVLCVQFKFRAMMCSSNSCRKLLKILQTSLMYFYRYTCLCINRVFVWLHCSLRRFLSILT